MNPMEDFESLLELISYFNSEEKCLEYLIRQRWGTGPVYCPHCGAEKTYKFSDGKRYKCSECRQQFTAKIGTIFEDSKIPLLKWYVAIYLSTCHKKGISSHQLAKDIKVTQKTAWFMLQRIRFGSGNSDEDFHEEDTILLDESFVGGKNKNRHKDKKVENSQGRSFKDKTPVLGIMRQNVTALQDGRKEVMKHSMVKCFVVPSTGRENIQPIVRRHAPAGAIIVSDEWSAYTGLNDIYDHRVVDHGRKQYVNAEGDTTNALEGFWTWLKRSYIGIHHYISRKHLQFYANEVAFRFNTRMKSSAQRIGFLLAGTHQKLSYKTLIAQ